MGCGSSSSKSNVSPSPEGVVSASPSTPPPRKRQAGQGFATNQTVEAGSAVRLPPMTFEVPIERKSSSSKKGANGSANSADNIVRQHPPKRFMRLEEQQQVQLTHQALDDKQAEADLRRQKILNQRIQSAHVRKHRRKPVSMDTDWKVSGAEDQLEQP